MRFYFWLFMLIALDQASKYLIIRDFYLGESRVIIEGIIAFTYIQNSGAAFGILAGKFYFFVFSALFVSITLLFYNIKYKPTLIFRYASVLVVGGALGNVIDRILWDGSVIDFIDLYWWPIFNVADMAIVIGAFLMGIYILKEARVKV